uniref:RNA-directed DNA polymerase, eukaryota n=1 Tax=Tanacetum cinerariifolium TaxID=118510 RepID=A0A6L2KUM4_TANCI|nr:RNA-directed DNA polymerase, eukaryota [Tanacetum cinerariifolium]
MESIRMLFFNGHEMNDRKPIWVKWSDVLTSKEKGGLGVPSLYALNRALLFKWVWHFYSQKSSLWAKEDTWKGDSNLKTKFPRIFALKCAKNISAADKMWIWSKEGSGKFSVASARRLIDDQRTSTVSTKTRWVTVVLIKINVFACKMKFDRLPTRFNISRCSIDIDSILCTSCKVAAKTVSHVFFSCHLARDVFRLISL